VVVRCLARVFVADVTTQDGTTDRAVLWYEYVPTDQRGLIVEGARFTWTAHETAGNRRTIGIEFEK